MRLLELSGPISSLLLVEFLRIYAGLEASVSAGASKINEQSESMVRYRSVVRMTGSVSKDLLRGGGGDLVERF